MYDSSAKPFGISIVGVGAHVPEQLLTNFEVEAVADLPHGYIERKTGILQRFIVSEGQSASDLAVVSANAALENACVSPESLDLIVCATFSADYITPGLACKLHQMLAAKSAGAFDVMANCNGFQVAITLASDRLRLDPSLSTALVVGVAVVSRYVDWRDGGSAIYFGDGSGAAVLGKVPYGFGFLSHDVFSHTHAYEAVRIRGGGSSFRSASSGDGRVAYLEISGLDVWKQAAQHQPIAIRRALAKAGLSISDVDFFIFHQANLHLINYIMGKLRVPADKTHVNVDRLGNTAEASMAIALSEAVRAGKIKHGDIVVLSGVGAGFIFGASVLRWYAPS